MTRLLVPLGLALVAPNPAWAISLYVDDFPNGDVNGCTSCHTGGPGSPRNAFGQDFEADPNWSALAALDSDGDGCDNGLELGDPLGTWVPGDEAGPYVSNPADISDADCGAPPPDIGTLPPTPPDDDDDLDEAGCSVVGAAAPTGLLALSTLLLARRRRGQ